MDGCIVSAVAFEIQPAAMQPSPAHSLIFNRVPAAPALPLEQLILILSDAGSDEEDEEDDSSGYEPPDTALILGIDVFHMSDRGEV